MNQNDAQSRIFYYLTFIPIPQVFLLRQCSLCQYLGKGTPSETYTALGCVHVLERVCNLGRVYDLGRLRFGIAGKGYVTRMGYMTWEGHITQSQSQELFGATSFFQVVYCFQSIGYDGKFDVCDSRKGNYRKNTHCGKYTAFECVNVPERVPMHASRPRKDHI